MNQSRQNDQICAPANTQTTLGGSLEQAVVSFSHSTFRTTGRFPKNRLRAKLRTIIKSKRRTLKKLNERAEKKHFREILVSKIPKKGTPEKCKLLRLKTK